MFNYFNLNKSIRSLLKSVKYSNMVFEREKLKKKLSCVLNETHASLKKKSSKKN